MASLLPAFISLIILCTQFDQTPVSSSVREPIVDFLRTGRHKTKPAPHIDDLLGRLFSGGIKTFCRKHGIETSSIDLVGTHSGALKLSHRHQNFDTAREHRVHWNTVIAAETGISTVFDFIIVERAVARPHIHPIAYVDRIFLRHATKFRVCLNIDEFANLSFIPPVGDNGAQATISRDCGPGSLLIDYAMRYCTSNDQSEDHDGELASRGTVNQSIVDCFLDSHNYLRQLPPLNMATEMFGDHEAQQLIDECLFHNMNEEDTIATITRITAQNILKQYQHLLHLHFPPGQKVDELFICGPGARNSNVVDYLEAELPESVITKPLHDIGIPGDAHEAVCYAHLAFEVLLSRATHSVNPPLAPSSVHAEEDAVRARVVPGARWKELLSHALAFSGGQRTNVTTNVCIAGSLEPIPQVMELR